MQLRAVLLLGISSIFSTFGFALQPDRITAPIDHAQTVALKGNVHGLARPEFDQGRANAGRMLHGVSLAFRPSAAQQKDLDRLLTQLQDKSSPNYHKFLTPAQFADRFGMTPNDVGRIVDWLQSEGFTNISLANSRNEISFDGTVARVELVFGTEFHNYLVDGEVHLANATEPSVPAALAGAVLAVGHLHTFGPKPRVKIQPHLTSYVSGNHFLSPDDFATIYDLNSFYSASPSIDGSGQEIAIVGQSLVNPADISNFRSAAGLSVNPVTVTLIEGTNFRCSGDERESDLDLEWSGAVAKNASITFLYAGLGPGDSCGSRRFSVWDALNYAVQHRVAPFISTSYGFYEAGNGQSFALMVQGWARQGQAQGQTIVSSSGDNGAADGDGGATSAVNGLAVDMPASIPEVTGAGGNEFTGDTPGSVTGTAPNTTASGDAPYWSGSGTGSDTLSSALEYITEEGWNDTITDNGGVFSASGGGASIYFTKPSWQAGTGVPNDGWRDVPDISLNASQYHDSYLFCSEDGPSDTIVSTCTAGFRTGTGGSFTTVGGTSAVAPTFSGILALINQYLKNVPPTGLAPVNPTLYQLAAGNPTAFHDVTAGDNKVACTSGTANCPAGTTEFGFTAGNGYDQVTGLGSVKGFALAQAWAAPSPSFTLTAQATTYQVAQGQPVTATVKLNANNGFNSNVTYTCSDPASESICTGPSGAISSTTTASFNITTTAPTAALNLPMDHSPRIFYATLLPGLLGIMFTIGSRKRSLRGMRLLGLIVALGFSTLWMAACGGSNGSSNTNPGTPTGSYTITITATAGSETSQTSFVLQVVP